jgi:hypothetical protein
MRIPSLLLFPALLAIAQACHAAPDPLAPMSYLAGHCWKGEVPATVTSVEHCFVWVLDRHALRDTHTVRAPGKRDVVGETTYFWNPVAKAVEYVHLDNTGVYARGVMETVANTLYFPPSEQSRQNAASAYRIRWNPLGEDAFQAFNEGRGADGIWFTLFQMTLRKTK